MRVEELDDLSGGQPLPPAGEGLEINLVRAEDDLQLHENATLPKLDAGVQVRRMGVAVGRLDGDGAAGESLNLHLEMETLEQDHVLAGLCQQGSGVRRWGSTRCERGKQAGAEAGHLVQREYRPGGLRR